MAKATRARAQRADADSLPLAVWLHIFSLLPADARACCAAVRRAWRAALADACHWQELDLSPSSGVRVATEAVLAGAAARAGGRLRALNVSGVATLRMEALLAVLSANAAALRTLYATGLTRSCAHMRALLAAAPRLSALHADVRCSAEEAPALLRAAPPFAPLRLRHLELHDSRAEVARKAEWLMQQMFAQLAGAAPAPAAPPHVGDVATALAAALRDADARGAPASLDLSHDMCFLGPLGCELAVLLSALERHGSVQSLHLELDLIAPRARGLPGGGLLFSPHGFGVPAALCALLAADAPALRELHVRNSGGAALDDALAPLCDALPANSHLRALSAAGGGLSRGFVRERLLPALRANSGVRALALTADETAGAVPHRAGRAAMEFIRSRAAAAGLS
jgi:hypothetical protein